MSIKNIPSDLNAEELLLYIEDNPVKVELCGTHKRDAYMDVAGIEGEPDNSLSLHLSRNSIYDVLPECMFHSIDRFDNIPANETKERFAEELRKQEEEKANARRFFAPIDLLLLQLKCNVKKAMNDYTQQDTVLVNTLTDSLSDKQRNNRFIRRTLPLMPSCRNIRGDRTLLTLMLRKILGEEGLSIEPHVKNMTIADKKPKYEHCLGCEVGKAYVGNVFDEDVVCYDIHYWSDDECNERFMDFIDDIEQFRLFVADWFLSVEDTLEFGIVKDEAPLRLSDTFVYNYLNYNTNL